MAAKRYNREFINQFRQDYFTYACAEEQQHGYLKFRQFAGNPQELGLLSSHLSNTIHDVPLISRLIGIMENDAIPGAGFLAAFIKGLKTLFTTYAEAEPYTATYYNQLLSAVSDLQDQAKTFQKDTHAHLLSKLKTPFTYDPTMQHYLDIDSDVIRKIDDVIEYYVDNFDAYNTYFNAMIRQERAQEKQQVAVDSQVAWYLSRLVVHMDKIISHLQDTREILFEWEAQLAEREVQELYN